MKKTYKNTFLEYHRKYNTLTWKFLNWLRNFLRKSEKAGQKLGLWLFPLIIGTGFLIGLFWGSLINIFGFPKMIGQFLGLIHYFWFLDKGLYDMILK